MLYDAGRWEGGLSTPDARSSQSSACWLQMSKRYQIVKNRIAQPSGGFIEAFRAAIVEFTCLGPRHFDVAGYPHDDEADALASDWQALGQDFRSAIVKVRQTHDAEAAAAHHSRIGNDDTSS